MEVIDKREKNEIEIKIEVGDLVECDGTLGLVVELFKDKDCCYGFMPLDDLLIYEDEVYMRTKSLANALDLKLVAKKDQLKLVIE